ncbi:hypothetical protein N0V90_013524 [Kalmusia sp. IMI 367209]|nr:hypothetical protein N0V90_013524 [Kalmusia sp. IMI 367209]
MSRYKPTLNLAEMGFELGFDFQSWNQTVDPSIRYYSDLMPVSTWARERFAKEYDEHLNRLKSKHNKGYPKELLQELDKIQVISHGQNRVIITQRSRLGFYRFAVDIHYDCGFYLPLLFTEDEACRIMSITKLKSSGTSAVTEMICGLPREIRDMIYTFAFLNGEWRIEDFNFHDRLPWMSGLGDPSGFYSPLNKHLGILSVNKQMRHEALPIAYRTTTFRLDEMDDLLKLLIAVGEMGRDNIEVLYFRWESSSDVATKWEDFPDAGDYSMMLPSLHVMNCVRLLKQCKRLRHIRLYFDRMWLDSISLESFKADAGILELRSIHIEKLEACDGKHETIDDSTRIDSPHRLSPIDSPPSTLPSLIG